VEAFRLYGISDPQQAEERDPTFAFEISGESAQETKKRLWENHSIQIADGNHYSAVVYRHLGKQALCRASFAHYDTMETAETFIEALRSSLSHD
jgi:selenocysteine lyase/cysteine desulfurase